MGASSLLLAFRPFVSGTKRIMVQPDVNGTLPSSLSLNQSWQRTFLCSVQAQSSYGSPLQLYSDRGYVN